MLQDEMKKEEGVFITRTGTCRFCGQIKAIEAPENWDLEKVDELVAESCDCDDAVWYKHKKRRKENVHRAIDKLVETESIAEKDEVVPQEAVDLLHMAADPLCDDTLKAITIETENGLKVKMNVTAKDSIKMERKKVKKKTREM